MSENTQNVVNRKIISTVLHQINVEDNDCKNIPIKDHSDLEDYLTDVLHEIKGKEQKRIFDFGFKVKNFRLNNYFFL